jgi:1-acyl-sn-glycerol-3-phosphate acyltransferase
MSISGKIVTFIIKKITRILCRVHDEELHKVPNHGPLIIVANHVNFLEVPVLFTHLLPRPVTGYAASKSWKNPLFAFLFNRWGAISIRRGELDMNAIRLGLQSLDKGAILAIAPEGTRSGNGRLQHGRPGVVLLACKSGAPLLPVVYFGGEQFWGKIRRFRRTDFYIRVGDPFYVQTNHTKMDRSVRQQIVNEVMYQMAALLPTEYRGKYADLENATERYLAFPQGSGSNLTFSKVT